MESVLQRARSYAEELGLSVPILLAPMAGACPPELSIEVIKAGGLGACGVLLMGPAAIADWSSNVRSNAGDAFQLNIWVRDPSPERDHEHEARLRQFLTQWADDSPEPAGAIDLPPFDDQFEAMVAAKPRAISSVMGLFTPAQIATLKRAGISWLATVTTVAEAEAAAAAGADALIAQGMEAGGHRGSFIADDAESKLVGTFALVPAIANATGVPVIATGGIADGRTVAAALMLGASAVQIGTGFLRCPESGINPAWQDALKDTAPEDTILSRVFSGRAGRSIATDYVRAATSGGAPRPAPYPIQRALTAAMRAQGERDSDLARMQAWCGQSSRLGSGAPAAVYTRKLWRDASVMLGAE